MKQLLLFKSTQLLFSIMLVIGISSEYTYAQNKNTIRKPRIDSSHIYCLDDTTKVAWKTIYEYNKKGQLTKQTRYNLIHNERDWKLKFYDKQGRLAGEEFYIICDSVVRLRKTKLKYDSTGVLLGKYSYSVYDKESWIPHKINDTIVTQTEEYTIKKSQGKEWWYDQGNKLVKEIDEWGNATKYRYRKGRLVEKRESENSVIKYKYKKGKLHLVIHDPVSYIKYKDFYTYNNDQHKKIYRIYYEHKGLRWKKLSNYESKEYFYKDSLLVKNINIDNGFDPSCIRPCSDHMIRYFYSKD